MEITPQEIMNKVSASAPYLAAQVRDSFKDNEVHWELTFSSISGSSLSKGSHRVFCYSPYLIQVRFEVDLDEYPAFKSLDKEKSIGVIGKIEAVDELGITLKDVTEVKFLDSKKEPVLTRNEKTTIIHPAKDVSTSDKLSKPNMDFFKQIILHPVYSLLILGIIVSVIFYATGINLKDFTL